MGGMYRRIVVPGWPQAKNMRHYSPLRKNRKSQKELGDIVQMVEPLPSKCMALISNPSPTQKKI
jgi:hypothetical protein